MPTAQYLDLTFTISAFMLLGLVKLINCCIANVVLVDELRTNIEGLINRKNRIFEENKEHLAKVNMDILKLMKDALETSKIKGDAN